MQQICKYAKIKNILIYPVLLYNEFYIPYEQLLFILCTSNHSKGVTCISPSVHIRMSKTIDNVSMLDWGKYKLSTGAIVD